MHFPEIWRSYYPRLATFIQNSYRISGEDAQDLIQEIMLKVFKKMDTYSDRHSFATWIYTIARNTCIDYLRRIGREEKRGYSVLSSGHERYLSTPIDNIADDNSVEPQSIYEKNELKEDIRNYIAGLKQTDQELLFLKLYEEMNYRSIASITSIPVGTLKYRFFEIRKGLKNYLERKYGT